MTKDRESTDQRTSRISSSELARLAELSKPELTSDDHLDAVSEWEGEGVAIGTPARDSTPVVSRTSTRHDPLTTAVLAEIARVTAAEEPVQSPSSAPASPSPNAKPKR